MENFVNKNIKKVFKWKKEDIIKNLQSLWASSNVIDFVKNLEEKNLANIEIENIIS